MKRAFAPFLIGLTGVAVLIWLGTWQMNRLEWKQGILSDIETRISGPFQDIPPLSAVIPERDRYTPVALTGEIGEGALFVLVSRKQVGPGYLVISPFTLNDGRRILLERGFIAEDQRAADLSRAGETIEVQGNLHWPDDRTSSTPQNDVAKNIWFARDIEEMAEMLGTEPLLVIARKMSPPDQRLTPMPVDTTGIPNDHLQYAITWFSLAAVWALMTALWIRRSIKEGN